MGTLKPNPGAIPKRRPSPVRVLVTFVVCAACVLLCAGFWLTERDDDPAVLGWYGVQWFAMAVSANAVAVLCMLLVLRSLWSRGGRRADDPRRAERRSLRKRLAFTAVVLAPLVIGLEVGLRYYLRSAEVDVTTMRVEPTANYHAHLQVATRAKVDGRWTRTFRERVHQRAKTTEFRIVCLGGSTTWGAGVQPDATWPAVLERILREDGHDVEVINAGFPWYTTAHSIANYTLLMRYFEPDVVTIMHGVNDLYRSFPKAGEPPTEWDYGSYQGPLRRILRERRRPLEVGRRRPGELLRSSAMYRFLCAATGIDRKYYSAVRSRRPARTRDVASRAPTPSGKPARAEREVGPEAFVSIASFRAHLDYLVELCQRDGCRVVVGTQAHVYGRPSAATDAGIKHTVRELAFRLGDDALVSPRSVAAAMHKIRGATVEIAEQHGVPVADAESVIDARPEFFGDDFHLNVEGNALVAEVFAEAVHPILDDIRQSPPAREPD